MFSIPDMIENVGIYAIFGGLAILSTTNARRRHWLRRASKVSALAVLFSAMNEAMQLYTADRVASVTDIVSAAIGALGGAAIVAWWVGPQ